MVKGTPHPWEPRETATNLRGKTIVQQARGYQQRVWCVHCPATGIISVNLSHKGKYDGILLPDAPFRQTIRSSKK